MVQPDLHMQRQKMLGKILLQKRAIRKGHAKKSVNCSLDATENFKAPNHDDSLAIDDHLQIIGSNNLRLQSGCKRDAKLPQGRGNRHQSTLFKQSACRGNSVDKSYYGD